MQPGVCSIMDGTRIKNTGNDRVDEHDELVCRIPLVVADKQVI